MFNECAAARAHRVFDVYDITVFRETVVVYLFFTTQLLLSWLECAGHKSILCVVEILTLTGMYL